MADDYLMRLIDRLALLLAELSGLQKMGRGGEVRRRIAEMCIQETGLPFEVVKKSSPQDLLELLRTGGATYSSRAVTLAELLLQDAELNDNLHNTRDANIERVQAYVLLLNSVDKLDEVDQAVYRPKLQALAARLNVTSGYEPKSKK